MRLLSRRGLGRLAIGPLLAAGGAGFRGAPVSSAAQPSGPAGRVLGAFVHGAPNDAGALDRFAERIRRQPVVVSWFEAWGSASAVTGEIIRTELLDRVTARGAVPMVTWEPWDPGAGVEQPAYQLAVIARGDFDAYVNSWAFRLAAYGGPVWLRFAHEMNAPWYPWGIGVNGNSADDYVAAWLHLRDRFAAAGATNVRWVWCVDATTIEGHPFAAAYPGDDAVDWTALDGYNWGSSRPNTTWRGFGDVFGVAYDQVVGLGGRPMMIAETACAEQGGNKADWITEGLAIVPERFPRITALCWFNERSTTTDWRVESSPESLAAFASAVSDPAWQGHPGWGEEPA